MPSAGLLDYAAGRETPPADDDLLDCSVLSFMVNGTVCAHRVPAGKACCRPAVSSAVQRLQWSYGGTQCIRCGCRADGDLTEGAG